MSNSKRKFRNAAAAKTHRESEASWIKLTDKWRKASASVKPESTSYIPVKDVSVRETKNKNIKSLKVWVTGTLAKKESRQYTGDRMRGVAVLHKSNGVPVFSDEEIIDIARMRR